MARKKGRAGIVEIRLNGATMQVPLDEATAGVAGRLQVHPWGLLWVGEGKWARSRRLHDKGLLWEHFARLYRAINTRYTTLEQREAFLAHLERRT